MIPFKKNSNKVEWACQEHFDGLFVELIHRMSSRARSHFFFKNYIDPILEELLVGRPSSLIKIHDYLGPIISVNPTLLEDIEYVFKYEKWFDKKKERKYCAYDLASNLDINTCTYCNRIYTKTVVNPSKLTRPQFDHWFPKSKYPLLALSFYNLIPSCSVCNSGVKGKIHFSLDTHLHPYVDDKAHYQFSYFNKLRNKYAFNITFKGDISGKSERTINAFKLKEIYKTHEDEIKDLVELRRVYSKSYLQNLVKILKDTEVSYNQIYKLAFGTYIEESKFDKRPLSKMKKDILTELGIIE